MNGVVGMPKTSQPFREESQSVEQEIPYSAVSCEPSKTWE